MNLSITNGWTDQLAAFTQAKPSRAPTPAISFPKAEDTFLPSTPNSIPSNNNQPQGARLIAESREELGDNGYRLTRTFERGDGRSFTKIEEFTLTSRGAHKIITQQNPSGSITFYEEILDKEESGNFRRTQRFQEAGGDISTHITPNYKVADAFILTGGDAPPIHGSAPFQTQRGTQLDLRI